MERRCKDRILAVHISCSVLFHILHLVTLSESLDERLINQYITACEGDTKTHLICETKDPVRHEQISWYRTTLGDSASCPNSSALTTTHETYRLVFCDLLVQHRIVQSRFTNRFRIGGLGSDQQNDLIFEKVEKKDAGIYACVGKERIIQLLNVTVTTNELVSVSSTESMAANTSLQQSTLGSTTKREAASFSGEKTKPKSVLIIVAVLVSVAASVVLVVLAAIFIPRIKRFRKDEKRESRRVSNQPNLLEQVQELSLPPEASLSIYEDIKTNDSRTESNQLGQYSLEMVQESSLPPEAPAVIYEEIKGNDCKGEFNQPTPYSLESIQEPSVPQGASVSIYEEVKDCKEESNQPNQYSLEGPQKASFPQGAPVSIYEEIKENEALPDSKLTAGPMDDKANEDCFPPAEVQRSADLQPIKPSPNTVIGADGTVYLVMSKDAGSEDASLPTHREPKEAMFTRSAYALIDHTGIPLPPSYY